MAFDEQLADRVREALAARADVTERKMFGGIASMIGGNPPDGLHGQADEKHGLRRPRWDGE